MRAIVVAVTIVMAPAAPVSADDLTLPQRLIESQALRAVAQPRFTPPGGLDCIPEISAQSATADRVVGNVGRRWYGSRDRAASSAVLVFDTERSAKTFMRPILDTDRSEECVEYRLERDARRPGDTLTDDRLVDVGDVPTATFLSEGTSVDRRGVEQRTLTETIVVRVGAAVVESSWTARRDTFVRTAPRFERAVRAIARARGL